METPNVPVVPVQSPSPLHDKSMKWNILIGGGLLVVGIFSYFLAGGGIFKGQIILADVTTLENCVSGIPDGGFKVNEVYYVSPKNLKANTKGATKDCDKFVQFASSDPSKAEIFVSGIDAKVNDDKNPLIYDFKVNTNLGGIQKEIKFNWDFGDGSEHVLTANTSHTYTAAYAKEKGNVATIVTLTATTTTKDGKPLVLKATKEILPKAPAVTDEEAAAAKAAEEAKAKTEAEAAANAAAPVANISNFSAVGDATIPATEIVVGTISFSEFSLSLDKEQSKTKSFVVNVAVENADIGDIRNISIFDGTLNVGSILHPVVGDNNVDVATDISKETKKLTIIANFDKVTDKGVYKITLKGVNFSDDKVIMNSAATTELSGDKYSSSKTGVKEPLEIKVVTQEEAVYSGGGAKKVIYDNASALKVAEVGPDLNFTCTQAKDSFEITCKANIPKLNEQPFNIKWVIDDGLTWNADLPNDMSIHDLNTVGLTKGPHKIKLIYSVYSGLPQAGKQQQFTNEIDFEVVAITPVAEKLTASYIENSVIGKSEGLFMKFLNDSKPDLTKITSFKWNLGEGIAVETNQDLEHVYKYPALNDPEDKHMVALTVSDGTTEDTYSSDVTIKHPVSFKISCRQRPETLIGICTLAPFEVNYSDNVKTVDFDFGDGTIITKNIENNLIPNVEHPYVSDGTYNVVVTMTDDFGLADLEKNFDFKVVPAAEALNPVPQVSASAFLYADSFHATANSMDIENGDYQASALPLKNAITVGAGDAVAIVTYADSGTEKPIHINFGGKQWNFGVGEGKVVGAEKPVALKAVCSVTPSTGTTATEFVFNGKGSTGAIIGGRWDFGDTTSGKLASDADKTKDFKHIYTTAGTYTASLEIVDEKKIPSKCETKIVVSAADKPADKPAEKPTGNVYNTYNTYTTTTTTQTPAAPAAPAAPTEGISRSVISPTIFAEKPTGSKLCSGLVDTKSPIVLDDTLNSTVGFLTQLKYKNDRVINGYNLDGKVIFNAAKEITKAEFLKILFYGSCMDFKPTTTGNWYDGIWAAATKKGLVSSSEDPNAQLTIREAMVILSKVATVNKAPSTFKQYFVDVSAKDKDYSKFQDMAYNDIYLGRLVNGERRADPSGLVLREVAASILNNYLSK